MKAEAVLLLVAGVCACHKREDATPAPVQTDPPTATTSVIASPAPSETASVTVSASASAGPSARVDPEAARKEALEEARAVGMIGLLNAGATDAGAKGNMWGEQIGESFGAGGLGLSAFDGGGGRGEGIGLGNIGTLGHGAGTGTGQGFGRGSHRGPAPQIRQGAMTVTGRLPPEVIQRIVRQNFGRFRLCYENGLRTDPKLAGTVATKFVIGADGGVSSAARDSSTTLTDASVASCVTRAFSGLSFPQPEGGIVVVVYPVIFTPGD